MDSETRAALVDTVGRGFTVLCTLTEGDLLAALAEATGPTGLLIAAGEAPPVGGRWQSLRCALSALPLRAHIVDAAVLGTDGFGETAAEEARRVLVPAGALRLVLRGSADAADGFLRAAAIQPLGRVSFAAGDQSVLVARGP